MDIVFVRNLEARTVIGAHDWERQIKQQLVVNLEMATDIRPAADDDDLSKAVNYSSVSKAVIQYIEESSFQLVETLAERLAELVLIRFGVSWVRLELVKPRPLSGSHTVGVIIERRAGQTVGQPGPNQADR